MTRFATIMTLLLTGGFSYGDSDIPSHIVQPLPRELNPGLEPAFQAPGHITRPLTQEEQTRRNRDLAAVDSAPLAEDGLRAIAANNARDLAVDAQIREFRKEQNVPASHVPPPAAPKPDSTPAKEEGEKEVKKEAKPTTITNISCNEGVYFDVEKNLLVCIKDVSIQNPEFSLTCKGPLKLYLYYNPEKDKKNNKDKKDGKADKNAPPQPAAAKSDSAKISMPGGGKINLNDLEKASASGDVMIRFVDKDGTPGSATADKITYDAKTKEIILTGNYPTITTGDSVMRSLKKDNFIRVYPNGSFYCNGPYDIKAVHMDKDMFSKDKPKKNSKP